MKKCSKCGEEKDESEFYNDKSTKDGKCSCCKICKDKMNNKYISEHKDEINKRKQKKYNKNKPQKEILTEEEKKQRKKEYNKKYRQEHLEEIKEKEKIYHQKNKDYRNKQSREYRLKHKEKLNQMNKKYAEGHKEELKEYRKQRYQKNKNNELQKLAQILLIDKLSKYEECRQDPDNPELLQVKCKYCGRWFNPTRVSVISRLQSIESNYRQGESNLYCSDSCKQSCPIYNQKKWPKGFKQATSRKVQPELRKLVFERDNWTCQKCGTNKEMDPDVELHCHHIDPVINNPIESADIDNCITLCKDCHQEVHRLPGCKYSELRCN